MLILEEKLLLWTKKSPFANDQATPAMAGLLWGPIIIIFMLIYIYAHLLEIN